MQMSKNTREYVKMQLKQASTKSAEIRESEGKQQRGKKSESTFRFLSLGKSWFRTTLFKEDDQMQR